MKIHEFDPLGSSMLAEFIRATCTESGIDRVGLFRLEDGLLQGIVGVDDHGGLESIHGLMYGCRPGSEDYLQEVALGEAPYRIVPGCESPGGGGEPYSRAAVPIMSDRGVVGVLAVDNSLSGRAIDASRIPLLVRAANRVAPEVAIFEVTRSDDLMGHLVDSLTEGICLMVTGGWILYTNSSIERMYRYRPGALHLLHRDTLFLPFDREGSPSAETHAKYNQDDDSIQETWNRRSDGTLFPVRVHLINLHPRTGLWCRIGVVNDLTKEHELAAAERERAAMNRRSAEMEGVLKIVRALQHEINNPLQALMGNLELLERDLAAQVDGRTADRVKRVKTASARIADVVKRMARINEIVSIPSPVGDRIQLPDDPSESA